jgi:hypothetical protein
MAPLPWAGDHDDLAVKVALPNVPDQLDAGAVRQAVVHQDYIGSQRLIVRDAARQGRRLRNFVLLVLEIASDIA